MTWNWQDLVTFTLVALAVAYLIRASWQVLARKKSSGCGTCAKCPTTGTTDSGTPVVTLKLTSEQNHRQ